MTQLEALINLKRFEEFLVRMWPHYADSMRHAALQSRKGLIDKLQDIQLKEFDNG